MGGRLCYISKSFSPSTAFAKTSVELAADTLLNFYQVLAVEKNASQAEIKAAYHRALILFHPDKNLTQPQDQLITISMIKDAYLTLSTPQLKKKYDSEVSKKATSLSGPRPAQIVSLEEFEEIEEAEESWTYGCRCGGRYKITGNEMEQGQHLVGCNSCSEVVWVGYELQEDDAN